MPGTTKSTATLLPDLPCACATLRRAARLVTQLYSHEMGGKIEPTQFAVLSALALHPGANQSSIGYALGLDKTTMSRSLQLMQRNSWIKPVSGQDGRERSYRLTSKGEKVLSTATSAWDRAQARLRAALNPDQWEAMFEAVGKVAEASVMLRQRSDA